MNPEETMEILVNALETIKQKLLEAADEGDMRKVHHYMFAQQEIEDFINIEKHYQNQDVA